jgi:hypothetical protein
MTFLKLKPPYIMSFLLFVVSFSKASYIICWLALYLYVCICIQMQITYMHTYRGSFPNFGSFVRNCYWFIIANPSIVI